MTSPVYGSVTVIRGSEVREVTIHTPHFRIGTHRPCEVVLEPGEGAPIHLECSWRKDGWRLVHSRTGRVPRLNDRAFHDVRLQRGDIISLGPLELRFTCNPTPDTQQRSDVATAHLVLTDKSGTTKEYPLDKTTTWLGRDAACDVRLMGAGVGHLQAALYWQDHGHVMKDRRCGARVSINGKPAEDLHPLRDGDELRLGENRLVYRLANKRQGTLDNLGLVVRDPAGAYVYPLSAGTPVSIGAGDDNDLTLSFGNGVRRRHARVEWSGDDAYVVDADAQPQVFVNGSPVARAQLTNGDFVRVGDARLVFRDVRSPALRTLSPDRVDQVRGTVRTVPIGRVTRIGRNASNDIVLDNLQVSPRHAEVVERGGRQYLRDLRSATGTFLNGAPVTRPVPILGGDIIRISSFHLVFDGTSLHHYSEDGNARLDAVGLCRRVPGPKVLLTDISLSIYPREFVAVVGGSGAGKTTLMKALCGFVPADEGTVLVNGQDFYSQMQVFRSAVGFVPQDDIIHRELNVRDVLYHSARLRLPQGTSPTDLNARIDEVMADLHLTNHQATVVSRLSGGQRKRVSIGVELLTRPRLFFLDEPTSGLDPGLESELMQTFRALADKGHTIILVTHATQSVNLCHKIVFLAEGGHLAFYGSPADALRHFGCSDFSSIYLRLSKERTPAEWAADFKRSVYHRQNIDARLHQPTPAPSTARAAMKPVGQMSALHQFMVLTQRYSQILAQDRTNLAIMLGSALVIALLLIRLFAADVPHPSVFAEDSWIQARLMTFFLMMAPIFFGLNNAIREIAKEMPIYRRERTVNLGIIPYVLSKVAVLSVVCLVQVGILEAVVLAHFNFKGDATLPAQMFAVLWISAVAAMAMGLCCSALMSNENKAASSLPLLILPQLFLTGSLPQLKSAEWLSYPTLSKWSFDILSNAARLWEMVPEDSPLRANHFDQVTHNGAYVFFPWLAALAGLAVLFVALTCVALAIRGRAQGD